MTLLPLSTRVGPGARKLALADRIKLVLGTRPGTLPFRPDFGVDLDRFVGRALTADTLARARREIESAFERYLPDVPIRAVHLEVAPTLLQRGDAPLRLAPVAEAALLPLGGGARLLIHLHVETPQGVEAISLPLEP